MKRTTKQRLSALLVIAMMLSLLVVVPAAAATTDPGTYSFSKTDFEPMPGTEGDTATEGTNDKIPVTEAEMTGITTNGGYFTFSGTAVKRASVSGGVIKNNTCSGIELTKKGGGALRFTVTGKATVTISIGSTSSSNTSDFALVPKGETDDTNKILPDNSATSVTGTSGDEFVWTDLPAGDYDLIAAPCTTNDRGTRVYSATAVQTAAAATESEAPASEAPASEAPASEAPASEAPASEAPASEAPASEAPASEAPASEAPASEAPASEAPASEAPVESETPVESQAPVASGNTWTPSEANLPGGGDPVAEELVVETGVAGITFSVGSETQGYKMIAASADWPAALQGKTSNPSPSPKDGVPTAGCYYKFVPSVDGTLTVNYVVGGAKNLWIFDNGTAMEGYNPKAYDAKGAGVFEIDAVKDHAYLLCCEGSKLQLVDFTFEPMGGGTTTGTWTPTADNLPGGGDPVAEELVVETGVAGVTFSVGSETQGYKMIAASADWPAALQGKTSNPSPSPKDGVPTAGCYYKFVPSENGTLKVNYIVGGAKNLWIFDNGTAMEGYNPKAYDAKGAGVFEIDAVKDHAYLLCCEGSKLQLVDFSFTTGGGDVEIVKENSPWTVEALGAATATPAADAGTVNVAVSGTKTGTERGQVADGKRVDTIYADAVVVKMLDSTGALVAMKEVSSGKASFEPEASDTYTFEVYAQRAGEEDLKVGSATLTFALPLAKPVINTASSKGGGTIQLNWSAVAEAEGYNVYMDGAATPVNGETMIAGTAKSYAVSGLEIGSKHTFTLEAVRGADKTVSDATAEVEATTDAKIAWGYTVYGPSSSQNHEAAWYEGDLTNGDTLHMWAKKDDTDPTNASGAGKIQAGPDGVCFYYTAIPADENFTLKAKLHVNEWTYSNGQEGFGLMATDTLGHYEDGDVYQNNYMVVLTKIEDKTTAYRGRLGLGFLSETGYTQEYLDQCRAEGKTITPPSDEVNRNLNPWVVRAGITGECNIVANCTNTEKLDEAALGIDVRSDGKYQLVSDFLLELERNPTGMYARVYNADTGELLDTCKTYGTRDDLIQQDKDNIYVGFMVSRLADITVSNVELSTVNEKDDVREVEEPEKVMLVPTIKVASPKYSNTDTYDLILTSNVRGEATVSVGGKTYTAVVEVQGTETSDAKNGVRRANLQVPVSAGDNIINVTFTPYPESEQNFDNDYTVLDMGAATYVTTSATVTYKDKFANQTNIYVSPKGSAYGTGAKSSPLDIYTAVSVAQPGQKVILMEGTYKLITTVTIGEGIDGTKDNPIYLIADPDATSRPVLDFQRKCVGIEFSGDYWYCEGFDVCNAAEREEGIALAGSNNVFKNVNTYRNGGSGFQLSRINGYNVLKKDWPSNNILINCVSFLNMDAGHEDADGFGTKLTMGDGNEFYGCVAAYNADDGWDCFAKAETGPIGVVKLYNCIAFMNGYVLNETGDGVVPGMGNGNGLKMGGQNITGPHEVHDSYAFFNKAKGLDSNSGPDIKLFDSISYNNQNYNVALYTENSGNTNYEASGIISLKDENLAAAGNLNADNLKPVGTTQVLTYKDDSTYYWTGTASANKSGTTLPTAAELFESIDVNDVMALIDVATNTVTLDETGAFNLGSFLKVKDTAPEDVKAIAPKSLSENLANVTYPFTIDPNYATIVEDDLSSSGTTATSGRNDRGGAGGSTPTTPTTPTTPAFTDVVKDSWYEAGVTYVVDKGLFQGVAQNSFAPELNMTRAMLMTVLARLDGQDTEGGATWYEKGMAWAVEKGVSDGTMGDSNVTREQMVTMLYRYAKPEGTGDLTAFVDGESVSDWAVDAISWAVGQGILTGKDGGLLDPQGTATRAEVATIIQRFVEKTGK